MNKNDLFFGITPIPMGAPSTFLTVHCGKAIGKLIYKHAEGEFELYNLKNDISEKRDLAMEEPGKLSELVKVLSGFLREAGALMPTIKQTGRPVPWPDEI